MDRWIAPFRSHKMALYGTTTLQHQSSNASPHWEKFSDINNTFKRGIPFLVNWHISTDILNCVNLLGFQWFVQTCRLCCRIFLSWTNIMLAIAVGRVFAFLGVKMENRVGFASRNWMFDVLNLTSNLMLEMEIELCNICLSNWYCLRYCLS